MGGEGQSSHNHNAGVFPPHKTDTIEHQLRRTTKLLIRMATKRQFRRKNRHRLDLGIFELCTATVGKRPEFSRDGMWRCQHIWGHVSAHRHRSLLIHHCCAEPLCITTTTMKQKGRREQDPVGATHRDSPRWKPFPGLLGWRLSLQLAGATFE